MVLILRNQSYLKKKKKRKSINIDHLWAEKLVDKNVNSYTKTINGRKNKNRADVSLLSFFNVESSEDSKNPNSNSNLISSKVFVDSFEQTVFRNSVNFFDFYNSFNLLNHWQFLDPLYFGKPDFSDYYSFFFVGNSSFRNNGVDFFKDFVSQFSKLDSMSIDTKESIIDLVESPYRSRNYYYESSFPIFNRSFQYIDESSGWDLYGGNLSNYSSVHSQTRLFSFYNTTSSSYFERGFKRGKWDTGYNFGNSGFNFVRNSKKNVKELPDFVRNRRNLKKSSLGFFSQSSIGRFNDTAVNRNTSPDFFSLLKLDNKRVSRGKIGGLGFHSIHNRSKYSNSGHFDFLNKNKKKSKKRNYSAFSSGRSIKKHYDTPNIKRFIRPFNKIVLYVPYLNSKWYTQNPRLSYSVDLKMLNLFVNNQYDEFNYIFIQSLVLLKRKIMYDVINLKIMNQKYQVLYYLPDFYFGDVRSVLSVSTYKIFSMFVYLKIKLIIFVGKTFELFHIYSLEFNFFCKHLYLFRKNLINFFFNDDSFYLRLLYNPNIYKFRHDSNFFSDFLFVDDFYYYQAAKRLLSQIGYTGHSSNSWIRSWGRHLGQTLGPDTWGRHLGQTLGADTWGRHLGQTLGADTWGRHLGQTLGADTWGRHLGQTLGADTWVRHLGQTLGADTWGRHLGQTLGADTWGRHLGQTLGADTWGRHLGQTLGADTWGRHLGQTHGSDTWGRHLG